MDIGQWNTYETRWNCIAYTKMYSIEKYFASLSNGQNPGDADKM